jgi:hypothetical protein
MSLLSTPLPNGRSMPLKEQQPQIVCPSALSASLCFSSSMVALPHLETDRPMRRGFVLGIMLPVLIISMAVFVLTVD